MELKVVVAVRISLRLVPFILITRVYILKLKRLWIALSEMSYIYMIQCKRCSQTYIGETVNFRNRMSSHKTNSADSYCSIQEVSSHLYKCGGGFWKLPIFKVNVENKIARLVIENNLIKKLKPDLNRDQRNLLHLSIGPNEG